MEVSEKVGIPEMYKYYKETLIKKGKRFKSKKVIFKEKHRYIIDGQTFSNILKDFNLELARRILEENLEFRMPSNLGTIRIRKYKKRIRYNEDGSVDENSLNVDWHATKALWARMYPDLSPMELKKIKGKKLVRHLNEPSESYICKLFWNKKCCLIINRQVYSLIFTRANKRRLATIIKTDPKMNYYE
jgi:hypothetical protein